MKMSRKYALRISDIKTGDQTVVWVGYWLLLKWKFTLCVYIYLCECVCVCFKLSNLCWTMFWEMKLHFRRMLEMKLHFRRMWTIHKCPTDHVFKCSFSTTFDWSNKKIILFLAIKWSNQHNDLSLSVTFHLPTIFYYSIYFLYCQMGIGMDVGTWDFQWHIREIFLAWEIGKKMAFHFGNGTRYMGYSWRKNKLLPRIYLC